MKTRSINLSLCLFCLGVSACVVAVASAPSETLSVLDRVQRVDDPELAELIRVAMENRRGVDAQKGLEIMRKVTQGYAQIRLLDEQIRQVARRIESQTGPAEIRYELLLAKAELESKRMVELATLREVMGVVPRHAFEKRPVETLNAWLALNVLDERVYVLDGLKPFYENWTERRWKVVGLLSTRGTLDYIREQLSSKNRRPLRIDIYYTAEKSGAAEDLHARIVSLATEAHAQMEVEARVELSQWVGSGESTFYLRDGKIRTLYPTRVRRPDGGPQPLVTGLVNPNDLEQHILWRLTMPKNVPLRFRVEYDEASALLARQVAETARATVKRLGIADVVEVAEALVQPVPEAAFVGEWQAVTDGEIRALQLQPGGQSRFVIRTGAADGTVPTPAPWTLATTEIFMDSSPYVTYRGYFNAEGNLVVEKGAILPQGSWNGPEGAPMFFTKVR